MLASRTMANVDPGVSAQIDTQPAIEQLSGLLFVVALLSGNAQLAGVDLSLVLMAICCLLVLTVNPTVSKSAILIVLGILLSSVYFCAVAMSLGIPYFGGYPLWPVKVAAGCGLFMWLHDSLLRVREALAVLVFCACAVLLISATMFGSIVDGRLTFIFGPNMLYRWVVILFGLTLVFSRNASLVRRLIAYGILLFCLFLIIKIGSRGGLVAVLGMALVLSRHRLALIGFGIGGLLALSAVLIEYSESSRLIGGLTLDAIRGSDRIQFWEYALTSWGGFFGHGYGDFLPFASFGFAYPHNLFVELIFFYGLPGFALASAVAGACAVSARRSLIDKLPVVIIVFWAVLLGSQLSGDLSDNFSVLVLTYAAVFVFQRSRQGTVLEFRE